MFSAPSRRVGAYCGLVCLLVLPLAAQRGPQHPGDRAGGRSTARRADPPSANLGAAPAHSHPIFLVTPARRATWARMQSDNHWLYQLATQNCALTGTPQHRYGDTGWWCAWLYQVTGDASAAAKVIATLEAQPNAPSSANDVREFFTANVILTDWVWTAASATDRTAMLAKLEAWAAWAAGKRLPQYVGGFRVYDEDQSGSTYFGLATLDLMTRDIAGTPRWLDSTMTAGGLPPVRIGGLHATDTTQTTARNTVEFWARMLARGGEDLESSEYATNTIPLFVLGNEALKTAVGADSLPAMTRATCAVAARMPYEMTPDLRQAAEWGDIEHPHDLRTELFKRITTAAMTEGVCKDRNAQRMLLDLWAKYGTTGYNSAEPIAYAGRLLALYDPYVTPSAAMPVGGWLAASRGHLVVRNLTSLASLEAQPPSREDHEVHYLSSVSLYRNGEWVIDRPLGYGGAANGPLGTNGPSYAGFGAMAARTFDGADSAGGRWCITGSTGGPLYAEPYYDRPPAFLRLGRRTTCYVQTQGVDVIITRDTVAITRPTRLDRYEPRDRAQLDTTGGWFTIWHPQTIPTRAGNMWTWTTRGGQTVQLTAFSPGTVTADPLLDESALWGKQAAGGGVNRATFAKQLRLHTTGATMTTVVIVGSGSLPVPALTAVGVQVGTTTVRVP